MIKSLFRFWFGMFSNGKEYIINFKLYFYLPNKKSAVRTFVIQKKAIRRISKLKHIYNALTNLTSHKY